VSLQAARSTGAVRWATGNERSRLRWRRLGTQVAVGGAWACLALALLPLVDMFVLVVQRGAQSLSWTVLTTVTSGVAGGLANAIAGTFLLVGLAVVFVVPLGILGGVYVAERRGGSWVSAARLSANVLAGVPSIVVGYFGFVVMVNWLGWGFSVLAGSIALTIIMLPYVFRAADLAVQQVPDDLREASLALGATQAATVRRVVLRVARRGLLTGVLLAVGIAVGETAPLIYTAGWSNYMPTLGLVHTPAGYLTYVVWSFINEPFASAHALAYAAALLLMLLVLALNVTARLALPRR
jgi:phosphate transport system permease protein